MLLLRYVNTTARSCRDIKTRLAPFIFRNVLKAKMAKMFYTAERFILLSQWIRG